MAKTGEGARGRGAARHFWNKQVFLGSLLQAVLRSSWVRSIVALCQRHSSPSSVRLFLQTLPLLRCPDPPPPPPIPQSPQLSRPHVSALPRSGSEVSYTSAPSCTDSLRLWRLRLMTAGINGIRCQLCSQVEAACSLSQKSRLASCHPSLALPQTPASPAVPWPTAQALMSVCRRSLPDLHPKSVVLKFPGPRRVSLWHLGRGPDEAV